MGKPKVGLHTILNEFMDILFKEGNKNKTGVINDPLG